MEPSPPPPKTQQPHTKQQNSDWLYMYPNAKKINKENKTKKGVGGGGEEGVSLTAWKKQTD